MARATAPTNQWGKNRGGGRVLEGALIDHPDFPGAVTFADFVLVEEAVFVNDPDHAGFVTLVHAGAPTALLVDDPNHEGFVTPDSAATAPDAFLYDDGDLGGTAGFITPSDPESAGPATAYLVDHPDHAGAVTPDDAATADEADAMPMVVGDSDTVILVEI